MDSIDVAITERSVVLELFPEAALEFITRRRKRMKIHNTDIFKIELTRGCRCIRLLALIDIYSYIKEASHAYEAPFLLNILISVTSYRKNVHPSHLNTFLEYSK